MKANLPKKNTQSKKAKTATIAELIKSLRIAAIAKLSGRPNIK